MFQGNGTGEVVCCGWEVHTLYRLSNISGEWYRRSCVLMVMVRDDSLFVDVNGER